MAKDPVTTIEGVTFDVPEGSIAMEAPLAQIRADTFFDERQRWEEGSQSVAVVFVDLVGSTAYKQQHGTEKGLAKTSLHNKLANRVVKQHDGIVIKYLGDGLLAVFQGELAARRALQAACSLVKLIDDENTKRRFQYPDDLATRVAVHFGPVWFFTYIEATTLDPQGPTVDLAARMQKLAEPQHVVCTQTTWDEAQGNEAFPGLAIKQAQRFVPGVKNQLDVVTFCVGKNDLKPPRLESHRRPVPDTLRTDFQRAVQSLKEKKFDEAETAFTAVLVGDPGNFIANFRLGELCLQKSNGVNSPEKAATLERAWRYLCAAKQVRPEICRVWMYLSVAVYKQFTKVSGMNGAENLDRAIQYVEEAIRRATEALDLDGGAEAKSFLARLLVDKHDRFGPSVELLQKADGLCADVNQVFDGPFGLHRANMLVTHALVRIAKHEHQTGRRDDQVLGEVDGMIKEAMQLDPTNVRAYEAKQRLVELHNRMNKNLMVPVMVDF